MSALLTSHFDYILTYYALRPDGSLVSYPSMINPQLKEGSKFEELRNPLYYFKTVILEDDISREHFEAIRHQGSEAFLQFLDVMIDTNLRDFSYPKYDQGDKEYYKRKRSL